MSTFHYFVVMSSFMIFSDRLMLKHNEIVTVSKDNKFENILGFVLKLHHCRITAKLIKICWCLEFAPAC